MKGDHEYLSSAKAQARTLIERNATKKYYYIVVVKEQSYRHCLLFLNIDLALLPLNNVCVLVYNALRMESGEWNYNVSKIDKRAMMSYNLTILD